MTRCEQPFLIVADAFQIQGRGVVVAPGLQDYQGSAEARVCLVRPDGYRAETTARIELCRFNRRPEPSLWEWVVTLPEIATSAVPSGTQLFISGS